MNADEIVKQSAATAKSLRWVANMHGGTEQEKGFPRTAAFYCQSAADLIESLQADKARLRADCDLMHDKMDAARDGETLALQEVDKLKEQLSEAQKREKAAVEDLVAIGDCRTCGNKNAWCDNPDRCKGYEWRGTHDGEE